MLNKYDYKRYFINFTVFDTKTVLMIILLQLVTKLKNELAEKENTIKNETVTKIGILQAELIQSKLSFETKIKTLENEKEREINHVYVRYYTIRFQLNAYIYNLFIHLLLFQGKRSN